MVIGIDPTVDFAFKRLLGSPEHADVTIHFLNAVLGRAPRITHIDFTSPILDKEAFDDKLAVLDVLATDEHGRQFDIEMQTAIPAGLPQRLTYYVATLYSMRLLAGQNYTSLRPTICICVLGEVLFPSTPDLHLDFSLRSRRRDLELTDHLQIHTLELPKCRPPRNNRVINNPIEKWAHFLRYAATSTPQELESRLADRIFSKATGVLEMIFQTPNDRALYELRRKLLLDDEARMEYALQQGEKLGMEQGMEKGMKKGLEQGLEKGMEKGALIGKLQLLQQLNGDEPASAESLGALGVPELQQLVDDGQEKLRQRRNP